MTPGQRCPTHLVVVDGARQVGKSTLVTGLLQLPGRVEVMTLDHEPTLRAVSIGPRTFVERSVDTLVMTRRGCSGQ